MKAYLAGGCFWCMEKPYHTIEGVLHAESGYCGGDEENPTYEQVKHQETGHRETVMIEYDETIVSFSQLLDAYFYNVDPFDGEGQFIDRGFSYTCAIYYIDETQKRTAEEKIKKIEEKTGKHVCVALEAYKQFYSAEAYHQDYAHTHEEAYAKEYVESGRATRKEEDKIVLL